MQKTLAQHVAFFFAVLSLLAAAGCVVGAVIYQPTESQDPIVASLMASTVFFIGVGVVLYVIATARLKGLLRMKDE
jgi:hypothetical protein